MRFALNIGTRTSQHYGLPTDLSIGRAALALRDYGFDFDLFSYHHYYYHVAGQSEDTMVLHVSDGGNEVTRDVRFRFHEVSARLHQDCIAVVPLVPTTDGSFGPRWEGAELIGPYASEWGQFNRAFFVLPHL